jgi:hypothetical protein
MGMMFRLLAASVLHRRSISRGSSSPWLGAAGIQWQTHKAHVAVLVVHKTNHPGSDPVPTIIIPSCRTAPDAFSCMDS